MRANTVRTISTPRTWVPPPRDTGRPQTAFRELADAGELCGRVLDVGCFIGEHALMAAALGLEAMGVDASPRAIRLAKTKADERGLRVRFVVSHALQLAALCEPFDTVLDSGLYHVFDDTVRVRCVERLAFALPPGSRYFMLCFSESQPVAIGATIRCRCNL